MEYYDPNEGRGLGIASLVVGIIAIMSFCVPFVGLVLGIIALSLSIAAYIKANKANAKKQIIIAALVVSIIATLFGSGALYFWYNKFDGNFIDNFDSNLNNNSNYFDQNDEYNNLNENFDSLNLNDDELDKLEKSMNDFDNGPGGAPKN